MLSIVLQFDIQSKLADACDLLLVEVSLLYTTAFKCAYWPGVRCRRRRSLELKVSLQARLDDDFWNVRPLRQTADGEHELGYVLGLEHSAAVFV